MCTRISLLALFLACFVIAALAIAKEDDDEGKQPTEPARTPALPAFVEVPPGNLQPGCTAANIKTRAPDDKRKRALIYDEWGSVPPFPMPAFSIGRYEISNAQWKHYLDRTSRVTHTTGKQETLRRIATQYVHFRDEEIESEWRAIYAFNHEAIREALSKPEKDADGKELPPKWKPAWTLEEPGDDPERGNDIGSVFLPKGLKLEFYRRRVPRTWYGWCKLSHLRIGREYCDIRKPAEEAFQVPEGEMWTGLKLRDKDFAAYPVRDLSPNEMLAFAEWAGCDLPSEYEFERAIRGGRPNTEQYPFQGDWARNQDKTVFAWADNPACSRGPLRVDDASVERGDTEFGARHMIGNVYELTRTFWDLHPYLNPEPPPPERDLFNYALIAKGGSFGDGWIMQQISVRTGVVGNAELDLAFNNRSDSLGLRLVRHPQSGQDLMRHSILKLAYSSGRGRWNRPYPHEYALRRMAGLQSIHIVDAKAPYVHVQERAAAIAFAPRYVTTLTQSAKSKAEQNWKRRKPSKRDYAILGILRSDVVLRAGVRLPPGEAAKLRADRAEYETMKAEIEKREKKRKKRRKTGEAEEKELVLPPVPPEPDAFERLTAPNEKITGLWREAEIAPGEWIVVYWNGFIGLANKALLMPPDAILIIEKPRTDFTLKPLKKRTPLPTSSISLNGAKNCAVITFPVEVKRGASKPQEAPDVDRSSLWALCEVLPSGWPGRKPGLKFWEIRLVLPAKKGELEKHNWN